MSLTPDAYARADETQTVDGGSLDELPTFELGFGLDDRYWPTEVTVFVEEPNVGIFTNWITIDYEHAVPLEEVA